MNPASPLPSQTNGLDWAIRSVKRNKGHPPEIAFPRTGLTVRKFINGGHPPRSNLNRPETVSLQGRTDKGVPEEPAPVQPTHPSISTHPPFVTATTDFLLFITTNVRECILTHPPIQQQCKHVYACSF